MEKVNEMSKRDLLRAEADRLERDSMLAEEDGNGDPVYLREMAASLRAEADTREGGSEIVDNMRGRGFDDRQIADALCDGEYISAELSSYSQEDIEDAYYIVAYQGKK